MRNILIVAMILVLIAILVVASPMLDVRQSEPGSLPSVETSEDGITAQPGEAPSFEVETGSVKMGDDSIEIQTAQGANAADDDAAVESEPTTPSAP